MVQDAHIARYNLVLQNGSSWDIDTIAMVGNDDHSALQNQVNAFYKHIKKTIQYY